MLGNSCWAALANPWCPGQPAVASFSRPNLHLPAACAAPITHLAVGILKGCHLQHGEHGGGHIIPLQTAPFKYPGSRVRHADCACKPLLNAGQAADLARQLLLLCLPADV